MNSDVNAIMNALVTTAILPKLKYYILYEILYHFSSFYVFKTHICLILMIPFHYMKPYSYIANSISNWSSMQHNQLFSIQPQLQHIVQQCKQRSKRKCRDENGDEAVLNYHFKVLVKQTLLTPFNKLTTEKHR